MLNKMLKDNATIIDVRMPFEFQSGNVKGSINIPLDEIEERFEEIEKLNQPLVLICRSGNRSGMAANYLKSRGIDCYNGGAWTTVNFAMAN